MKGQPSTKTKKFNKHYCIPCKLSKKKCSKQLPICDQCKSISFCCQYPEEEAQLKIRFYQRKTSENVIKKRTNSRADSYPPTTIIKNKITKKYKEPVFSNSAKSCITSNLPTQPSMEPVYSATLNAIPFNFIQNSQLLHPTNTFSSIQSLFNTPPNSEQDPKSDCSSTTSTYDCFNRKEFWNELVQLFITRFHPLQPIFNLEQFDAFSLSPACQAIIHCIGYHFKIEKNHYITQYLIKRVEVLSKPLLFKPTLSNTQSYTLISTYYHLIGNYKKSQFYLQQAIRFSLNLGLHQVPESISEGKLFEYMLTWKYIQALNIKSNVIDLEIKNTILPGDQHLQILVTNNNSYSFIHEAIHTE